MQKPTIMNISGWYSTIDDMIDFMNSSKNIDPFITKEPIEKGKIIAIPPGATIIRRISNYINFYRSNNGMKNRHYKIPKWAKAIYFPEFQRSSKTTEYGKHKYLPKII